MIVDNLLEDSRDRIGQHAVGILVARQVRRKVQAFEDATIAFDALLELADIYGVNSSAMAGFVRELVKP